ncbi:MAG: DUF1028 domain-containing protein [Candidatus Heimdallarchaeota archaeon]
MTFSIVGIDKENKEVGFAIASCSWNAGLVCRAIAEKGVIASQAQGKSTFLAVFFEQLEKNKTLSEIMDHFKEIDENIENRQIGLVNFEGDTFAFTGDKCSHWAGHKTGKDYACQGNILVGPEVIDKMTFAFENTEGSLTDRLYSALQAGDNAGGDARGKQNARVFVAKIGGGITRSDIVIDITIEDHDEPIKEIGRILNIRKNLMTIWKLYSEFQKADDEEKLVILDKAGKFLEDKEEARYLDIWTSIGYEYLELGIEDKAIYYFKKALEISPRMVASFEKSAEKNKLP